MKIAILDITVSPRSSKSEIVISSDNSIKAYLNSPPIDGKANTECIALFSKRLRIAKSRISIERGKQGRRKRIIIEGISFDRVIEILKEKK